jgi:hypothetical protein
MLTIPPQLTSENLAKHFMAFCFDRYPTEGKLMDIAAKLGIDRSLELMILVFSLVFRDGMREVSVSEMFGTVENRNDKLGILINFLDGLETQLQEKEDRAQRK